MNFNLIYEILKNPDKENLRIEYKQFGILDKKESKKKLVHEIVGISNKYGGHILIGITDDGKFEGKIPWDSDIIKGQINNLIHSYISPKIECEINFLQCKEGDVFLITVPKKKDIPFAYISSSNGEIIKREYLIRTSHGLKHVTDRQLQFLFQQEDINFESFYQMIINYSRKDSIIPINIEQPLILKRSFPDLVNNLNIDDKEIIFRDSNSLGQFLTEICPYILLINLSHYFNVSWIIEKFNNKSPQNVLLRHTIQLKKPFSQFKSNDLPKPPQEAVVLNSLNYEFDYYLNKNFNSLIFPPETEIFIEYHSDSRSSSLILYNPDFTLNFLFSNQPYRWGAGIERTHPEFIDDSSDDVKALYENFAHLPFYINYAATFNFPETNFDLFKDYYNFSLIIRKILKRDWDFNNFLKKLPHSIHYQNKYKLDKILDNLK